MSSTVGASLAQSIIDHLGEDFTLPSIDLAQDEFQMPPQTGNPLYADVDRVGVDELTEGVVGGDGSFDKIMTSHRAHLKQEFDAGRISGAEYATVYGELTTAALSAGVQMALNRQQGYWQALLVQAQARRAEAETLTAVLNAETAKAQLAVARHEASTAEARNVLVKMQVANEDAKYALQKEQLKQEEFRTLNVQPLELTQLEKQVDLLSAQYLEVTSSTNLKVQQTATEGFRTDLTEEQHSQAAYTTTNILPENLRNLVADAQLKEYQHTNILPENLRNLSADAALKEYQHANILPENKREAAADADIKEYQHSDIQPENKRGLQADSSLKEYQHAEILPVQKNLAEEKVNTERANTHDSRIDTLTVEGQIGKQKDLYDQQIESYKVADSHKVGKLFSDAWITQKTLDEGTLPPSQFTDANINQVLTKLRATVPLD